MQAKALPRKRAIQLAMATLLIISGGLTKVYAQSFFAQCETGQNLYYKVTNATNHYVKMSHPNTENDWPWAGHTVPTGPIILPETVTHNGVTYTVTAIDSYTFSKCSGLTGAIVIPNTVTRVGASAFYMCSGITSVTFGTSLTSIGESAFHNCTSLSGDLVIPNTVTKIEKYAFLECTGFHGTLTLSNSLTEIGDYAFYHCQFTGTLNIPSTVNKIGIYAFAECNGFTGNLILPAGIQKVSNCTFENCTGLNGVVVIPHTVTRIQEEAFNGCSNVASIYISRETPPTLVSNSFNGFNMSTPVFVPYCSIQNYSNNSLWSAFNNFQGRSFFIEDGNWSDGDKWTCGGLQDENDDVVILANCNMDVASSTIASLTLFNDYTLSIQPEKVLNVNTITNNGTASNLVVEYGGQLKYNGSVAATLQRDILAYSSTRDKYYFIASPMTENLNAATDVNGMITESAYDLYMFDQECADDDLEWRNYEANMFEDIVPTVGYLYANQNGTTIEFAGTTAPSGTEINVELAYTAGRPFTGYNLIGNPFICEAFVDGDFLVLNDNGDNFVNGSTIMPGDAIMVQADEEWQNATFTTTPGSKNDSYIELSIVKNTNRECSGLIDNARIRFGEGRGMDKLYLNASSTNIYIPENGKKRAVAYAADKNEMPVNFKAETDGTYTISADLLNVESDYLHLIDNLTGNDIDLKTMPVYTFEAKVTDYASRFRLMFAPANTNENEENFAFMSNGALVIDNMYEGVLQVVDVTGRILSSEVINGNYNKSLNLSAGVYVLRLVNNNNVKTQKIIVE